MASPGLLLYLSLACAGGGVILAGSDTAPDGEWGGGAATGAADTGGADTGAADTGAADTGGADTGAADTGAADTGAAGRSPSRTYDPARTITLHVHGWIFDGTEDSGEYGYLTGGGPLADALLEYGGLPHALEDPSDPAHVQGVHYYGQVAPDYYTEEDIAEVEALEGVPRYAAIVAKQARWGLAQAPEAEGVNFTCHSMGCEVTRYIIENDVEQLASDKLIKRWVTYGGVVAGAELANQFEWAGDWIQSLLGIDPIDIEHMTYGWFEANIPADGRRQEGNSPLLGDIITHHVLAVNPNVGELEGVALMDWLGFGDWANDGIMLVEDQQLLAQSPDAMMATAAGELVGVSSSHAYTDHFGVRETPEAHLPGVAAVVGSRRVQVVLVSAALDAGYPEGDAEIALETEVSWPSVEERFGVDALVDQRRLEHRVPVPIAVAAGDVAEPQQVLYDAPVFDEEESLDLWIQAVELDDYSAGGVREGGENEVLGEALLRIDVEDDTRTLRLGEVSLVLDVRVIPLY